MTVTFQDEHNAHATNDAANHRVAFLSVPELDQDGHSRATSPTAITLFGPVGRQGGADARAMTQRTGLTTGASSFQTIVARLVP